MLNEDWFTVGVQGIGWIISTYEYREGFIDSDAYKTHAAQKISGCGDISFKAFEM